MRDYFFHESTVTKLYNSKQNFVIELEDVSLNSSLVNVVIEVQGVTSLSFDSQLTNTLSMAAPDGEVLTLEYNDTNLFVLIEWHTFSPHKMFTHSYRATGNEVNVSVIGHRNSSVSD